MAKYWECPTCKKNAKSSTFACIRFHLWVHVKCNGKMMNDIKDVNRQMLRCTQYQEQYEVRLVYISDQFNYIVNIKYVILTANFSLSEKYSRYKYTQRQLTF